MTDKVSCMISGFKLGRKMDDFYDAINVQHLMKDKYNALVLLSNSINAVREAAKGIRGCNGSQVPDKIVEDAIDWGEHINHMLGMGIRDSEMSGLLDSLLEWRRDMIYDIKTMGDD